MSLEQTLKDRGDIYGSFADNSQTMQQLKAAAAQGKNWHHLQSDQKEAIEMILHKIGRILGGDPNHPDSWHDIAGYAQLVENRITGQQEKAQQEHLKLQPAISGPEQPTEGKPKPTWQDGFNWLWEEITHIQNVNTQVMQANRTFHLNKAKKALGEIK